MHWVAAARIDAEVPVLDKKKKMTCMKKNVADMNVSFRREISERKERSLCSVEQLK